MNIVLQFLLETVLGFFLMVVLLRFYFQLTRAPYRNPLSQFILAATDFAVKPLRRVVPGLWGIDMSCLLLAWVTAWILQLGLLYLLPFPVYPPFTVLLGLAACLAFVTLMQYSLYLLFGALIIQAVLSWTQPQGNPLSPVLNALTDPFLRPLRRIIPPLGGVDLTPLIVLLVVNVLLMAPIHWLEIRLKVWFLQA